MSRCGALIATAYTWGHTITVFGTGYRAPPMPRAWRSSGHRSRVDIDPVRSRSCRRADNPSTSRICRDIARQPGCCRPTALHHRLRLRPGRLRGRCMFWEWEHRRRRGRIRRGSAPRAFRHRRNWCPAAPNLGDRRQIHGTRRVRPGELRAARPQAGWGRPSAVGDRLGPGASDGRAAPSTTPCIRTGIVVWGADRFDPRRGRPA